MIYVHAWAYLQAELARKREWDVSVEVHMCVCVEVRWREDSPSHDTLELEECRFRGHESRFEVTVLQAKWLGRFLLDTFPHGDLCVLRRRCLFKVDVEHPARVELVKGENFCKLIFVHRSVGAGELTIIVDNNSLSME